MRMILTLAGLVATVGGLVATAGYVTSGAQPWGPTLSDNMVFARALPFILGLGVLVGSFAGFGGSRGTERRASDGAIRRYQPMSLALHWVAALGLLIGGATGAWQYLKGVLDVESPVFMAHVYRLHYAAAALMLFAVTAALMMWWIRGTQPPLPPKGEGIRYVRGLAHELPKPLGSMLAGLLGLNMRRQAPPIGQYTFYEATVSYSTWVVVIGLLAVTGILKAMRYLFPIPGDLLYWVSAIHVAGLVLLAVKMLDHVRYMLAPSRWPLLQALFTGWVSEAYVRANHPAWWEAIQQEHGMATEPQVASVGAAPQATA